MLALTALLVALYSPGPAIFAQTRMGARRRYDAESESWKTTEFTIYRFRTVHYNCDQSLHKNFIKALADGDVKAGEDQAARFKLDNDLRITHAGRFLRQTSLDDLSQIAGVVKGDMSLVGPRPVSEYELEHYAEKQRMQLCAVLGLTSFGK